MKPVIEAKNISKKYLISHQRDNLSTLMETLTHKAKQLFNKNIPNKDGNEIFWALKEINFEIQKGDRVAIIGRNGAGKSTLLKLLARITEPTTGQITIRGRVSSLLEVGTGFHPELTGRENIFLNGAILGMTHQEIKNRFDEIVAFSEIERFLDTPVKRFSSGMHMRLGFGIAAHLDPDVLVVDEVLSVGDARFQERCLKKLDDLSQHGRTVLFVSHDIGAVSKLCNKGILLENGQIKMSGKIEQCLSEYMKGSSQHSISWQGDLGDEHIRFRHLSLGTEKLYERDFFYQDEPIRLEVEYELLKPQADLVIGFGIYNQKGQQVARTHSLDYHELASKFTQKGYNKIGFNIPALQFYEGNYVLRPECFLYNRKNILNDAIVLKMTIYPPQGYQRLFSTEGSEGVSLGNRWVF